MKPDFSGEWVLNREASSLSGGAVAMDGGTLQIEQRDPMFGFRMNMTAGCESVEKAWEISSDGKEVEGGGVRSRLFWDTNDLVFDCRSDGSDPSWTMLWRYELLDKGSRLRATEQMRGSMGDQDNVWIFERH